MLYVADILLLDDAHGVRGHLSEVGTARSLVLAEMEQFSPSSEVGLCGSLIFCLFPSFGWSVRLQSC